MATLASIYSEFNKRHQKGNEYPVTFFQSHKVFLDSLNQFKNIDELESFQDLHLSYVAALVNLGRYNKAVEEISKYLPLIEDSFSTYNKEQGKDEMYRFLIFTKAQAHYYLKDYDEARTLFERLKKMDPNNDEVRKWLRTIKTRKLANNERIFLVIGFIVFGVLILSKGYFNVFIRIGLFVLTATLFLIPLIAKWWDERSMRKRHS